MIDSESSTLRFMFLSQEMIAIFTKLLNNLNSHLFHIQGRWSCFAPLFSSIVPHYPHSQAGASSADVSKGIKVASSQ